MALRIWKLEHFPLSPTSADPDTLRRARCVDGTGSSTLHTELLGGHFARQLRERDVDVDLHLRLGAKRSVDLHLRIALHLQDAVTSLPDMSIQNNVADTPKLIEEIDTKSLLLVLAISCCYSCTRIPEQRIV